MSERPPAAAPLRLTLRYDMRAPAFGAPPPRLYAAAIEQSAWADRLGFATVHIAEHHGADDGYCPAPIVLASAIASRTERIRIHLSALVAVLHHPLRLAEDLAVLDVISGGRLGVTLGIGYRPHEYAMFGVEKRRRVPILEEIIEVLGKAWTGEPFEFRGLDVVVRPIPVQRPGPPLLIGGSTEASALRAARLGDGYVPADPALYDVYADERRRLGLDVPAPNPRRGPLFVHVSDDPERDWAVVAPHLLYATNATAEWAKERGVGKTPYPPAAGVDDLRRSGKFVVVTPEECVAMAQELGTGAELSLQPLMGGIDPEVAWAGLERFESQVLPALAAAGLR